MTIAWEIDVDGLKQSFETRGDAVFARLRAEMNAQVTNLLSYVKDEKLSGQMLHQRTGNLKNSGFSTVETSGDEIAGEVGFGNTALYAVFQEQGASIPAVEGKLMVFEVGGKKIFTMRRAAFTLPARPFLSTSLDENREAITLAFQEAVDEEMSA
jgi:hypothetical protein